VSFAREVVPRSPSLDIDSLLDDRGVRVLVCCGSGGVGKTTTAAALALRAAERGRRVVVLTIDPARRLAQSLGLTELDNEPRPVAGVDGTGTLDAMMLDMKRTFDEFVEANADAERAATIIANPFYQSLSSSFAGTQEYMAMEKLGQLRNRSEAEDLWDLVVVDTPPSRSALDFLDAPRRLGSFLDGRFLRILAAPAKAGGRGLARMVSAGFGMFTGVLNRLLGAQVLSDIQIFVASVDTLFGGFRQRADETYQMLQAPDTRFVVIAAPERDALREASYFVDRLEADAMPLAGLVLNRVQLTTVPELTSSAAAAAADRLAVDADHSTTAALLRIHADRAATLDRQRRLADRFTSVHKTIEVATVPAMASDVVDLVGLRAVGTALADHV
jgi:anion-transporting  ArsA/GET3 family ATPase